MRLRRMRRAIAPSGSTKRRKLRVRSAMDAVPALTPGFGRPEHLAEFVAELDKVPFEPIRVVCDVPPRHFKSSTVHAWLAKLLVEHPWLKILYVTYGSTFAAENVEAIRELAIRAGVAIGSTDRENKFTTRQGGCVVGAGFDGILTGRGYHVIVVDDAHKSRAEAESSATRKKVVRGVRNDVFSRRQPGGRRAIPRGFKGTSIVVIGTRWHVDDVAGNILGTSPALAKRGKRGRWKHIHLPAINARGEALAPDYWPIEDLVEIREEYESGGQIADWLSLYQGDPQPEGGQRFRDVRFVDPAAIPRGGRFAIGLDFAHTSKTRSDRHAFAAMQREGDLYYLLEVRARRCPLTTIRHDDGRIERGFTLDVRDAQARYPGSRTRWVGGGVEDTTAALLAGLAEDERVYLEWERTQIDKLIRASPLITAWNQGRVLVPAGADWIDELMSKLISFTGAKGGVDDEIDAMVNAFEALSQGDGLGVSIPSAPAPRGVAPSRGRATASLRSRRGAW